MPNKPPTIQGRIKTVVDSDQTRTWTPSEIEGQLPDLARRQIEAALYHLCKQGKVRQPEVGVAAFASGPRTVTVSAPVNGRYTPGTLLEVVGYTEMGTLVLRNLDTQLLVPVKTTHQAQVS